MITKVRKIKKERSWEGAVFGGIFLVLVLGLVGLLTFSNYRMNMRRTDLINEINNLNKEVQLMEEKNSQLKTGITEGQKDIHWEEKIREQGYKKPGEEQVVVLPPAQTSTDAPSEEGNLWQKFLDKIGF
ncbi:MAG: hypothetical protein HY443_01795 [Candidatus Nealsonbacteria bacterium]|nr:hypothetical protein [Candidatus Nealsonbacteria bacterium]